jgi:glycerol uptake facilitator-like aquaporin
LNNIIEYTQIIRTTAKNTIKAIITGLYLFKSFLLSSFVTGNVCSIFSMILKKLLVLFLLYFVVGQRTGIAFNENRQVGGRWCGGRRLYPEQC